jgi:hypothetical protein
MALVPHFGQKMASFGSFSPQFEQCVIGIHTSRMSAAGNLNVARRVSKKGGEKFCGF